MNKLIIIGAGGHGKVVADIASLCGYSEICFLADSCDASEIMGYRVLGGTELIPELEGDFIVAIGAASVRRRFIEQLEALGKNIVTLVHPAATVSSTATLGTGTVVVAGAVINPDTKIGKGSIINTCASVDHDNILGDFVHVSVGAHLAGGVSVGDDAWIGVGAAVNNGISICGGCMIGSGAVVVRDITESGTWVGVPARKIK